MWPSNGSNSRNWKERAGSCLPGRRRTLTGTRRGPRFGGVRGRRRLQSGCVSPKSLQPVKGTLLVHKDVDDEIEVVHQDPVTYFPSFDVVGIELEVPAQALFHGIGNGEDLPAGRAVADNKVIGDIAQAPKVQDNDFLGLLLPGCLDALGEFWNQRGSSC